MSANRESDDANSPSGSPPGQGPRSASTTVGQQLAAARERQGLSVRETAERLHVVTRYVTAIEAGEYKVLPGVVFLKGYVRTYARIVGLDEDALSQALEAELQIRDDVHDHAARPLPHEPRPKNNSSMAILAGLFALALVALTVFLLVRPDPVPVPTVTTASGDALSDDALDAGEEAMPAAEPTQPELEDVSEPSVDDSQRFEAGVDDPVAEAEIQQETTEDFGSVRRGLYTTPDADPTAEPGIVREAEPVPTRPAQARSVLAPAPSAETEREAAGTSGELASGAATTDAAVTVTFTGDYWFDIRAANDERTVGLYREGQSLNFSGPLPMEVIVGAVGVTEIKVNGRPLDFSQYRVRNNRVEFSITSETLQ